jgi:uncharacterized membrane protein
MMKASILAYLAIVLTYLILDGIWLGLLADATYKSAMGGRMRENVIIWPWLVFYLGYSFSILYFTIWPHAGGSWRSAMVSAALLGATAYGAYNLTCYAILADWPLNITLKDWLWGVAVTTLSAMSGYAFYHQFVEVD